MAPSAAHSTTLEPLLIEMATAALVVCAPRLSLARAVKLWLPSVAAHNRLYGAALTTPNEVVPSKNSTLAMLPSASLAVADSVTADPAL